MGPRYGPLRHIQATSLAFLSDGDDEFPGGKLGCFPDWHPGLVMAKDEHVYRFHRHKYIVIDYDRV